MFEVDLGEILDEVEAGGSPARKLWDDGRYKLEIINANAGKTQGEVPKPKLGIQWKVIEGPNVGETQWENVILNKENKTSKSMFVKRLIDLGIDKELLRTSPSLESIAEMLIGVVVVADVYSEPWKSDATKIEQRYKILKLVDLNAPEEENGSTENADTELFGDLS